MGTLQLTLLNPDRSGALFGLDGLELFLAELNDDVEGPVNKLIGDLDRVVNCSRRRRRQRERKRERKMGDGQGNWRSILRGKKRGVILRTTSLYGNFIRVECAGAKIEERRKIED